MMVLETLQRPYLTVCNRVELWQMPQTVTIPIILVFPRSHEIEVPFDGVDQDCDGEDVCRDINCDAWPDLIFAGYYNNATGYNAEGFVFYGSENGATPI